MYWRAFLFGSRYILVRFYVCETTRSASDFCFDVQTDMKFLYNSSTYLHRVSVVKSLVSVSTFKHITISDKIWWHTVLSTPLPWWRHQMETFSALLAICAGNSPVSGEFPAQRPVTRSFDVFFVPRLNKPLSKQWWGWWFETLSCPLWRHCNVKYPFYGEMLHRDIFNSSLPGQDGRHFADDIFKRIFVNEKFCILITISLKFVPQAWFILQSLTVGGSRPQFCR